VIMSLRRPESVAKEVLLKFRNDRRGIDPFRLRSKSIEKRFLMREQADDLSDEQAVDLVSHAGVSTAEKKSDISGGGVWLDIVQPNMRSHSDDIQVTSNIEETMF